MNYLKFLIATAALCLTTGIYAQENAGQGSVTINQDARLQNIVSGEEKVVERKTNNGEGDNSGANAGAAPRQSAPRRVQSTQIVDVRNLPSFGARSDFDVRTGARRRLRGFRIQMFWGNSLRTDQLRAKRLADKVTGAFPELKSYVTFQQPHWRCRVGDFKTRAGAARYLERMRKIAPEAMIVRSEIIIYQ